MKWHFRIKIFKWILWNLTDWGPEQRPEMVCGQQCYNKVYKMTPAEHQWLQLHVLQAKRSANEQLRCKMSKVTRTPRSSQDKLLCSVVTHGSSEVLLRGFGEIDVKPNRVFLFFTGLEVPVESLSKPMNWLSPNTLVETAFVFWFHEILSAFPLLLKSLSMLNIFFKRIKPFILLFSVLFLAGIIFIEKILKNIIVSLVIVRKTFLKSLIFILN